MKLIAKCVIGAFAASASVMAAAEDPRHEGYLVNSYSGVVRNSSGECWQHHDPDRPVVDPSCRPMVKPQAAVAPAPAPVVIAAAPPAPAAAPAKPLPKKFSFSGDALFAFDKSVLKPEGKAMLDDLVRQLDGSTYDTIHATGHADRFGSNAYNQRLSEHRAHAVKDYLVGKNVQAGTIDAEGRGETQPLTKAGDCLGAKSAKVIACLQPDRRVDVEMNNAQIVTGSR